MPRSLVSSSADERSSLLNPGADARSSSGASGECNDGDAAPGPKEATTVQLLCIMSGVYLGAFMAALDANVVATLSAPISASFGSMSLLSWLASSYFIANAASQPLSGRLTDIYGRKAGLILCNAFFAVGNLICGFAGAEWVMIIGRVVAGIGGGGLGPIATFLASDLIPLRKRGLWQGAANICFGMGSALGGVFGGWMNDAFSWHWAFLAQISLTLLAGVLVYITVDEPVKQEASAKVRLRKVDFLGVMSLVTALVLMLLGLNSGGSMVKWTHPLVLTSLPLSALAFVTFFYIEKRVEEPILPVKLFAQRTVWSACLTNWFITMARFGILFYGPIYFQVQGQSAAQAGLRLVPESIGIAIMSILSGVIMSWTGRYYILNAAVEAVFVCSMGAMSTLTLATSQWLVLLWFFFAGLGYSGMLTVTLVALIAAVDQQYQAGITSASYAFRSTGSTIGITIASVVFQNVLSISLQQRLGSDEDALDTIKQVSSDLSSIESLPSALMELTKQSYMDALRAVFLTLLGIAGLGALVSLFMREHKLHKTVSR